MTVTTSSNNENSLSELDALLESPPLMADRGFSEATILLIENELRAARTKLVLASAAWVLFSVFLVSQLFVSAEPLITAVSSSVFSIGSLPTIESLVQSLLNSPDSSLLLFALLPLLCLGVVKLTD